MSRIALIVNPLAGRGHSGRMMLFIRRELGRLGADHRVLETRAAGDAVRLARQALEEGADTLVAVGGDGTSHEVINGMLASSDARPAGTSACIAVGSGNDFSLIAGTPLDVSAACRAIVHGVTRVLDVGRLTIDGHITRYFDNTVGVGLDGLVTTGARRLRYLRGMALYLPVVLKTIFLDMHPPRAQITLDGATLEKTTLMTVVANGRREGGGFLVAPSVRMDDGLFDIMIADIMPKLGMLGMIPRFMKGTHVGHPAITMRRAAHVVIASDDPLYLHADGEILCDEAHHLAMEIVPGALRMLVA